MRPPSAMPICLDAVCARIRREEDPAYCFFDEVNAGAFDALDFVMVPGCLQTRQIPDESEST